MPLHNSKEYRPANLAGGVVCVSMTGHASLPLPFPPEWIGVLLWNGKTKDWRRATTQSVFSPLACHHISSRSSWYSVWPEAETQYTNNVKPKVSTLSHSKKAQGEIRGLFFVEFCGVVHVFPVPIHIPFGFSGFFPQSKYMHVKFISYSWILNPRRWKFEFVWLFVLLC